MVVYGRPCSVLDESTRLQSTKEGGPFNVNAGPREAPARPTQAQARGHGEKTRRNQKILRVHEAYNGRKQTHMVREEERDGGIGVQEPLVELEPFLFPQRRVFVIECAKALLSLSVTSSSSSSKRVLLAAFSLSTATLNFREVRTTTPRTKLPRLLLVRPLFSPGVMPRASHFDAGGPSTRALCACPELPLSGSISRTIYILEKSESTAIELEKQRG